MPLGQVIFPLCVLLVPSATQPQDGPGSQAVPIGPLLQDLESLAESPIGGAHKGLQPSCDLKEMANISGHLGILGYCLAVFFHGLYTFLGLFFSFFIRIFKILFHWSIVDLQYCISFRCTAK